MSYANECNYWICTNPEIDHPGKDCEPIFEPCGECNNSPGDGGECDSCGGLGGGLGGGFVCLWDKNS